MQHAQATAGLLRTRLVPVALDATIHELRCDQVRARLLDLEADIARRLGLVQATIAAAHDAAASCVATVLEAQAAGWRTRRRNRIAITAAFPRLADGLLGIARALTSDVADLVAVATQLVDDAEFLAVGSDDPRDAKLTADVDGLRREVAELDAVHRLARDLAPLLNVMAVGLALDADGLTTIAGATAGQLAALVDAARLADGISGPFGLAPIQGIDAVASAGRRLHETGATP